MTFSRHFLRRSAIAPAMVAILACGPLSAAEPVGSADEKIVAPADGESLLGNYLAGRMARGERDAGAAADFYSRALQSDPQNEAILEQTFLLEATAGRWENAVRLAESLVKEEPGHRVAQLVLGCKAFRDGDFKVAEEHFNQARKGPIADLTAALAGSWTRAADGRFDEALTSLDDLEDAEWARFYERYHRGLIADLAGKREIAREAFAEAFGKNTGTLRIAEAYARHLAAHGDRKDAVKVLRRHIQKTSGHPLSTALLETLEAKSDPGYLAATPREGLAEVFYGIGDALTGEGGIEMGIVFLQLALYLEPTLPLANLALAEAWEATKKPEFAIEAYGRIEESSPLWLSVQIRKAFALNNIEKVDEAKALLVDIAAKRDTDYRPLDALGNILRSHERYDEALGYYDRAISLSGAPEKKNWTLYYARGVCYERLKQWDKAEADFKRALALDPDQPLVLNYLGYSWVDQNINLKPAIELIKKAVKLKPDDGYFVDSLGWAHYRMGNLPEAVEQMERAVELKPDDPVINDHLGDAYWQVGRRLEAKYQWQQSLTLKPDKDLVTVVEKKLKVGLSGGETKAATMLPQEQKVAE
jgi:Flp pilus assembly protein TadD